jgi:hypothetical protein
MATISPPLMLLLLMVLPNPSRHRTHHGQTLSAPMPQQHNFMRFSLFLLIHTHAYAPSNVSLHKMLMQPLKATTHRGSWNGLTPTE